MRVELERIKSVIKEVCIKEEKLEYYNLMSQILDFLRTHENMPIETIEDNVKYIIDKEDADN